MNMKLNPARHQRIGQSLKALREESRDVQQSAKDCLHNMAIEMVGKNGCVKSVYNQLGRHLEAVIPEANSLANLLMQAPIVPRSSGWMPPLRTEHVFDHEDPTPVLSKI
jgi:hypothetical protein